MKLLLSLIYSITSVEFSVVDFDLFLDALNFMYISWDGLLVDAVQPPKCLAIEYPIEKEEFNLTPEITLILSPNLFVKNPLWLPP